MAFDSAKKRSLHLDPQPFLDHCPIPVVKERLSFVPNCDGRIFGFFVVIFCLFGFFEFFCLLPVNRHYYDVCKFKLSIPQKQLQ